MIQARFRLRDPVLVIRCRFYRARITIAASILLFGPAGSLTSTCITAETAITGTKRPCRSSLPPPQPARRASLSTLCGVARFSCNWQHTMEP